MKRHEAFCTELDVALDACCNWPSIAVSAFPLVVIDNNKVTSFIEVNILCNLLRLSHFAISLRLRDGPGREGTGWLP